MIQADEVMVVVSGRQATVRKDWAPLIIRKHALVARAMEAKRLGDGMAVRTFMKRLISVNRQIARKGIFIQFVD